MYNGIMKHSDIDDKIEHSEGILVRRTRYLARLVLAAFIFTFISARFVVYCIMTRIIPDLYLYMGGTHLHHLNFGIFLLASVGAYAIFTPSDAFRSRTIAILYGIGLALTFDEFGMWLHLGGSYWQRTSWDACLVLIALLALLGYAPPLKKFNRANWSVLVAMVVALLIFATMLIASYRYAGKILLPRLLEIELSAPN